MYVRCDESSLYSRLTMSTALTGTSRECPGIIKTMQIIGLARTHIVICQRPGADTEENRTLSDLCGKISGVVF